MKKLFLSAVIAALGASGAAADEIQLTNGHKITGKVTRKDGGKVTVEVGAGTITLDAKEVSAVSPGRTKLDDYNEKWQAVKDSTKASDYFELAKWAKANGVSRHVGELCLKTISLDAEHAGARAELRHEKVAGKWLSFEEAQTARGLVLMEDRWITKAEVQLIEKRRLEAKERAMAAAEERQKRADEARAARQAAIDDYNHRLAAAMAEMDGYFYSPSFAFTTPYFRPYWWSPYLRSRSVFQNGWKVGYGGYPPTFDVFRVGPFSFR
ncbi:MAG: hypothetical protein HY293_17140 [Planctomycetes bacterium]|nr:hypothetical protein [Planctomycetota bacterium]